MIVPGPATRIFLAPGATDLRSLRHGFTGWIQSSESAELDSYHCDVYHGLCAGVRGLVITHQSPLAH